MTVSNVPARERFDGFQDVLARASALNDSRPFFGRAYLKWRRIELPRATMKADDMVIELPAKPASTTDFVVE